MGVYKAFKVAACGDDNGFVYEDFYEGMLSQGLLYAATLCYQTTKSEAHIVKTVSKLLNPKTLNPSTELLVSLARMNTSTGRSTAATAIATTTDNMPKLALVQVDVLLCLQLRRPSLPPPINPNPNIPSPNDNQPARNH